MLDILIGPGLNERIFSFLELNTTGSNFFSKKSS